MLQSAVLKKNIVLVGFMGCGKSKVSRLLADVLGWPRYSTDKIIEKSEGRTIPEIFAQEGEAYFRRLEAKLVSKLSTKKKSIIDCGGGVVINSTNIKKLKKNGNLFYLNASPESLYENIKLGKVRPLLQVENPLARVRSLLRQRQKFYGQADFVIDGNFKSVPEMAEQILGIIHGE